MKPTYPKGRLALGAILLVSFCATSVRVQGADLKTIDVEESYVVDGQPVSLRQNLGETVIKLDAASANTVTELHTTANGTYAESRKLDKQSALFSVLPPVQPTTETSQSVVDELNTDARVVYAYPVFVNPATGLRVFLNDEIVVCFNQSPGDVPSGLDPSLGLTLAESLSAANRIYVFRLKDPKNSNPFRICQSLLANNLVVWAEPNIAQEGQALGYPPNDTL